MDKGQLINRQNNISANLESAKEALQNLPNVLAVAIGMKEKNNEFTNEISFKVFVKEKKPLSLLKKNEIIPPTYLDIKTDVITPFRVKDRPDVCGTERRTLSKHRPLKAGIAISTNSTTYGTLGWFGKLSGGTDVLLTNKHVLYDTTNTTDTRALPTAQPQLGSVSNCCCCSCGDDNVIGSSIIGIRNLSPATATSVDCAIASIDTTKSEGITLAITNDSSTQILTVAETPTAQAVVGENVRKVGARSGFTQGIVVHLGDAAVAGTDPVGGAITIRTGQVLIIPDPAETYQVSDVSTGSQICKFAFSNNGDSGSVILNDSNQIVALLYGGDETTNSVDITFANNINNVLSAFTGANAITLSSSPGDGRNDTIAAKPLPKRKDDTSINILKALRDENRDSALHKIYEEHHEEVLALINHKRAVTITWQRNEGPAFVAAIARSATDDNYKIPLAINNIKREVLLEKIADTLYEHGSEDLKKNINAQKEALIKIFGHGKNINELAENLKQMKLLSSISSIASSN